MLCASKEWMRDEAKVERESTWTNLRKYGMCLSYSHAISDSFVVQIRFSFFSFAESFVYCIWQQFSKLFSFCLVAYFAWCSFLDGNINFWLKRDLLLSFLSLAHDLCVLCPMGRWMNKSHIRSEMKSIMNSHSNMENFAEFCLIERKMGKVFVWFWMRKEKTLG